LNCKEDDIVIYSDGEEIRKAAYPDHIEKYRFLPSCRNNDNKNSGSPIKHFLAVPILGERGKVFGALRVMNRISKEYTKEKPILDEHGFRDPEDVKLLKTIASLLSQALCSERKAGKLRALHEITDEISEKTDIKGIGDLLVQSVVERLGYSACSMRLVTGNYLKLISEFGFKSDRIYNIIIPKDEGAVGRAVKTNKFIYAQDILSDDDKINGGYLNKDFAEKENFRSAFCVPIGGRKDEAIGVIVIYMRTAPYYFEDYEIYDNFFPIAATCAIALRKVQAVDHLQKLADLLGLVHQENSKFKILDVCIKEILGIFDAHSAIVYETKKSPDIDRNLLENLVLEEIYTKNIDCHLDIPDNLLLKIKKGGPQTFSASEFPTGWHAKKKQYDQCLAFTLEFREETVGLVILFTKVGHPFLLPFILHEDDRIKLASAISWHLAIVFKNLEITDEIERMRVSQPAIISAQYVSGMIHELNAIANKGKLAVQSIMKNAEYDKIANRSRDWEDHMTRVESSFDDIGTFTTQALQIKNMGRSKFMRSLEYRSINEAIRDVIHDFKYEARKRLARIDWDWDKNHDQKHAYFDEILIKQAIRNLISNSIKWIPAGGNREIIITSGQKGDYISIMVEDNGPGIKPGTEKSIFDPFFTTSETGYGIGLFFVKNVVKMHEGEVILASPRNPTKFEIKISGKLKKGGKAG
jgi:signal transduction histidine kinase